MSKYRNKEGLEVGSGDEVTETLLEINTPSETDIQQGCGHREPPS